MIEYFALFHVLFKTCIFISLSQEYFVFMQFTFILESAFIHSHIQIKILIKNIIYGHRILRAINKISALSF